MMRKGREIGRKGVGVYEVAAFFASWLVRDIFSHRSVVVGNERCKREDSVPR